MENVMRIFYDMMEICTKFENWLQIMFIRE